jgi:periplasmic protein TonB
MALHPSSRWSASVVVSIAAHAALLALLAGNAIVRLELVPTTIELAFVEPSDRTAGPGERAPELRMAAPAPSRSAPAVPTPDTAPPAPQEPTARRPEPAAETPTATAETTEPSVKTPEPPAKPDAELVAKPEPVTRIEPKLAPNPAAGRQPKSVAKKPAAPATTGSAPGGPGSSSAPAAGPGGTDTRSAAPSWAPAARVRYEQVLFAWMNRHKRYPMIAQRRGLEGIGSLRVRIDRSGRVLERTVVSSTGEQLLDQAALDMVRRASPFPAVPSEYAGESFEFVAPIQYRLR